VKEAVPSAALETRSVPYCRHSAGTSHVKGSIRENVGAVPFFSEKKHNTASLSVRRGLDPNFGVLKYTVVFCLYLIIIIQPLTN
jgi:hypothetical protein